MELKQIKSYEHIYEAANGSIDNIYKLKSQIDRTFNGNLCNRILVVQCPQMGKETFLWDNAKSKRYPNFPPYGPAVIVRIVELAGHVADIIDLNHIIMRHATYSNSAEEFDFDIWQESLDIKIKEFQPDLIGLSCMFNMGHQALADTAKHIKNNYNIPIVAGGVHVSLTTDQLLKDIPEIDFALLYEADYSFPIFLDVVNGVRPPEELVQISTLYDDEIVKLAKRATPEELTCSPDYKDLPVSEYSFMGKIGAYTFLRSQDTPSATVLSARGCRAKCGFCSVRSVNGPGVRTRDYIAVVDEIEHIHTTYGIKHIMWLDDDLFYDNHRATALLEELASRQLPVTWCASNGIIAAALNQRLLKACVDSKCAGFNIGIESGNPEMLALMKKPGTVQSFRKAAKLLEATPSIFTKGFLVIGFPNESLNMLLDSINLALEMKLDWYPCQILTPMPGTPIFQMMQDQGLLGDIPTTVLGKARTFSVGATGSLGRREKAEKQHAKNFKNLFSGDLSRVPERAEMEDLYFIIDYKINYEIILNYTDLTKIRKKRSMLKEICERMTSENALGMLYWGITEFKLENIKAAKNCFDLCNEYLLTSDFWRKRFNTLDIYNILVKYQELTKELPCST